MSSESGVKILIPVEIQTQAYEVIREMKKEIDEMDSKLSKFQNSGLGASVGAASIGSLSASKSRFLTQQGIFQAGAGGDFDEALEQAVNDSIEQAITDKVTPGFSVRNFLIEQGMSETDLDNWFNMIKNPRGFFQNFFTRVLPILGGIYTAKEIAEFIFYELTARGRIFDLTFRRTIEDEYIKFRERELRQQIRVGERNAIYVTEAGTSHVLESVNTFELVRNGDIFDNDAFRVRKGYQF